MSSRLPFGLLLCFAIASPLLAQDAPVGALRQITHAQNLDPSFSPDGRRMVYISVVAGREQLFVSSTDGKDVRQLTADSVDHEDPAWSPDGAQIAFVYLTKTTEQIALLPAGGGSPRVLTPSSERAIHPNWAPDSRHLAYCTDDDLAPPQKNAAAIRVMDLVTHQVRELITGGVNTYPAWSPDGRHIAFRRILGETNSEVFLADSDGTNVRNLTNHPAFDGWPAWSPDGQYLAFASNRDGDYQIYVMRTDGTGVRLVTRSTGRGTAPKWTPDGRAIYFSICRREDAGSGCEIFAATAAQTR
jgi:TolB protein